MTDPLRERLQTALGTSYALERELGGGGMSRVFDARGGPAYNAAIARVSLGDTERTLAWLAQAVGKREEVLSSSSVSCEPLLDALRSDPRFTALLGRMRVGACIIR